MSTELVAYTPQTAWLEVMAPAAELANQIANTEFVPKGLRGSAAKVTACILYGQELGLGPMQALAKIDVIEGRPAISAELGRAMVLSAGHELEMVEATATKVTWRGRRRGSEAWQAVTWTMDDAKRANLANKNVWRNYPRHMLSARASAELMRGSFADCLAGVMFTEEFDDATPADNDTPATIASDAPKARKRRVTHQGVSEATTAQRGPSGGIPAAVEEPPLPGEDDIIDAEVVEDLPPADQITEKQTKMMLAQFGSIGIKDKGDRLALTVSIIGRPVTSSKELTKAEASKVIDAFVAVEEGRAELRNAADGSLFIHEKDDPELDDERPFTEEG